MKSAHESKEKRMALTNIKDDHDYSFELCPPGVHKARCSVICDLGLKVSQYGSQQKLYWAFEMVETRMEGEERPFSIGEQMTTKFGKNNSGEPSRLRGRLEGWRGRNYTDEEAKAGPNLSAIIGKPCLINVMHETDDQGKTWPRIASIMPAKEDEVPQLHSESIFFSWEQPGQEASLPEWLQKKLGEFPSEAPAQVDAPPGVPPGYQGVSPAGGPNLPDDFDDDIPFMRVSES